MSFDDIVYAVKSIHVRCRLLQLSSVHEVFLVYLLKSNAVVFRSASRGVENFVRSAFWKVKHYPVFSGSLTSVCVGNDESSSAWSNNVGWADTDRITAEYIGQLITVLFLIS